MPNPKDPEALAAYRDKMRRIALERGYGKWMRGKKMSPESIAKTAAANRGKTISVEHRQHLRDLRQAELDAGKELFGGAEGRERQRSSAKRRLTYEEKYGERAEEERQKRRDGNRRRWPSSAEPHPRHGCDWRYAEWRRVVFLRDDFICQVCRGRGGKLHAHHIKEWATHPDLRYEVANGATVHAPCHRALHAGRVALGRDAA